MACLWKQRSLDYFCLTTTGKFDFYFAAIAVFLGENLFNEKELQGRDGLVPRSVLPDAQFLMDCRIFI